MYESSQREWCVKIYIAINTVKKVLVWSINGGFNFCKFSKSLNAGIMRKFARILITSTKSLQILTFHMTIGFQYKIKIMAMIPYANVCVPNKLIFNLLNANFTAVALISKLKRRRRRKSHKQLQLFFLNLFWCFYNVFR